MLWLAAALCALACARPASASDVAVAAAPLKPHIIMLLVDDYGWANVGFHAKDQDNADEIQTPVMDALAASGVILDRHYVFRFCSPSRSSFNTGRNPLHVNTGNDPLTLVNPSDPVSGFAGVRRRLPRARARFADPAAARPDLTAFTPPACPARSPAT